MYNPDWFGYMKDKSFVDKLIAFEESTERMMRASYESCGQSTARDWYRKEYEGQKERVNWLFEELKNEYELERETKMFAIRKRHIVVDGVTREIDNNKLIELSKTYLPSGMSDYYKRNFADEVGFLISDLEFESIDLMDMSVEEYYFAACLAYAEENGFNQFFEEEDSTEIFNYCGSILE